MKRETCETCRFWEMMTSPFAVHTADPTIGMCRRYPPPKASNKTLNDFFPHTESSDWCGEHSPKEKEPVDGE